MKTVQKEPTGKRCLLIPDLKPFRSQVKGKHSAGREFESLVVRDKKLWTYTSLQYPGMLTKKSFNLPEQQEDLPRKKRMYNQLSQFRRTCNKVINYRNNVTQLHFDNDPRVQKRQHSQAENLKVQLSKKRNCRHIHAYNIQDGDRKITQSIRIARGPLTRKRK